LEKENEKENEIKREKSKQEIFAIFQFMYFNKLKNKEQKKFMESYLHLYKNDPNDVPIKVKLQTAYDDYRKKQILFGLPHIIQKILKNDKKMPEE
jgi:hypothetical protein